MEAAVVPILVPLTEGQDHLIFRLSRAPPPRPSRRRRRRAAPEGDGHREAVAGFSPVLPLRVCASLSRPRGPWEAFGLRPRGESDWTHHFGVSPALFAELVASLEGRLQGEKRSAAAPGGLLAAEKRVALTLSHLASGDPFEDLADQFGVEPSVVAEAVVEVCSAVEEELLGKVVRLPPNVTEVMDGFSWLGMPRCIGAVDEVSFCLPDSEVTPESSALANEYSFVVLQAMVNHRGRFIDIEVALANWRTYDSSLLLGSALCAAMDAGALVPGNPTLTLEGVVVPPLVVADGAYPMRRWLMTPYRLCQSESEMHFNHTLRQVQSIAKHALRQLKSRWQCLTAPFQLQGEDAGRMVAACVVLHNIYEENGHGSPLGQRAELEPLVVIDQRDHPDRCDLPEGEVVRDAVARHMFANQRPHSEEETGG